MGDILGFGVFWNFGVLLTVGDVRPKTAFENFDAIAKVGNIFLRLCLQFGYVKFASLLLGNRMGIERFDADK